MVPTGRHHEADALAFTSAMVPSTTAMIENELHLQGCIKVTLVLQAALEKLAQSGDSVMIATNVFFRNSTEPPLNTGEIQKKVNEAVSKALKGLEEFTTDGYG